MDVHRTILDSVEDLSLVGAVDGDLIEIASQAISMGIRIGKDSPLQDSIGGWAHSRHKVARIEGRLFSLSKVIDGVSVKDNLPDLNKGIIFLGDHLGGVKHVPFIVGGIPLRDCLNKEFPLSGLPRVDMVHHIPLGIIRILEAFLSLLHSHILDSREGTDMDFNPKDLPILIFPSE